MHDILKVHDVSIWFASGRISTFTAMPAPSQGYMTKMGCRRLTYVLRRTCDLAKH